MNGRSAGDSVVTEAWLVSSVAICEICAISFVVQAQAHAQRKHTPFPQAAFNEMCMRAANVLVAHFGPNYDTGKSKHRLRPQQVYN